ncbi:MAG: hypothetical protein WCA14_08135, partial [Steroidobacteraceae bacterium]
MTSKTLWIAGGIAVAIGVVAYVGYNAMPAGNDGAGTIVEAKRAQTNGTNAMNPTSTPATADDRAKDSGVSGDASDDRASADRASADRASADRASADRASADRASADRASA